jgi:methylphosphotriester-DNA--protein-cysteine methyltransferase
VTGAPVGYALRYADGSALRRRATANLGARGVNLGRRSGVNFERRLTTGMSFSRWRQLINAMLALQWLAEGQSIQQVSAGLGYESASSFVTQFRKVLGVPPCSGRAERRA